MAPSRRRGRRRLRGRRGRRRLWWGRGRFRCRCGCFGCGCGRFGSWSWCGCFGCWSWCGCFGCWRGRLLRWAGRLLLWLRPLPLPRRRRRLFYRRRRCFDRRRDRLYRGCRDLWLRRHVSHGGWSDQCDRLAHRAMSPLRSEPRRHRQLRRNHHAQGGAHQGGDQRTFGKYSPPTPCQNLRRRCAVLLRCGHRLTRRRAAPLICGFARKPSGDSRLQPVTISIIAGASRLHCYRLVSIH
jgi:hypothetical protein